MKVLGIENIQRMPWWRGGGVRGKVTIQTENGILPVPVRARTQWLFDFKLDVISSLLALESQLKEQGVPRNSFPQDSRRAEANRIRNYLARKGTELPRR